MPKSEEGEREATKQNLASHKLSNLLPSYDLMSFDYAMKIQLAVLLVSISSGAFWPIISYAETSSGATTCEAAKEQVKIDIEQRLGGKIIDIAVAQSPQSPFADARDEVVIELDANMHRGAPLKNARATPAQVRTNANIVNSTTLSHGYARSIIKACPSVARVYFFLYELNQGYSLHENQLVTKDRCIGPDFTGSPQSIPWGQQMCI